LVRVSRNFFRAVVVAVAFAAALYFGWVLILAVPGLLLLSIFAAPFLVVLAGFGALVMVTVMIRYYRVAALALIPALLLFVAAAVYPSVRDAPSASIAHWVQFSLYKRRLDDAARRNAQPVTAPRLTVITTDGFLSMSQGFAYDPSGDIARPAGQRSALWESDAAQTELSKSCYWRPHHLYASYYFWTSQC
jgi:hypothetical protein